MSGISLSFTVVSLYFVGMMVVVRGGFFCRTHVVLLLGTSIYLVGVTSREDIVAEAGEHQLFSSSCVYRQQIKMVLGDLDYFKVSK